MRNSDRGPYQRIRWFCNDGSVLPPKAFACRERGGGHQHAQYSEERERLSKLGFDVGTIFTGMQWAEFFDESRRHQRLRGLLLENYLQNIDDGWVLYKARHYRGHVQVEDEIFAGRTLLERLFADTLWVRSHYLLAREVNEVVPHGAESDALRDLRRDIQELAITFPSADPLRVEIHTAPNATTVTRLQK